MNNFPFEEIQNSAISYFVGGVGVLSQGNILFVLGAAVMAVRLIYDVTRLIRYIRDPSHLLKD